MSEVKKFKDEDLEKVSGGFVTKVTFTCPECGAKTEMYIVLDNKGKEIGGGSGKCSCGYIFGGGEKYPSPALNTKIRE